MTVAYDIIILLNQVLIVAGCFPEFIFVSILTSLSLVVDFLLVIEGIYGTITCMECKVLIGSKGSGVLDLGIVAGIVKHAVLIVRVQLCHRHYDVTYPVIHKIREVGIVLAKRVCLADLLDGSLYVLKAGRAVRIADPDCLVHLLAGFFAILIGISDQILRKLTLCQKIIGFFCGIVCCCAVCKESCRTKINDALRIVKSLLRIGYCLLCCGNHIGTIRYCLLCCADGIICCGLFCICCGLICSFGVCICCHGGYFCFLCFRILCSGICICLGRIACSLLGLQLILSSRNVCLCCIQSLICLCHSRFLLGNDLVCLRESCICSIIICLSCIQRGICCLEVIRCIGKRIVINLLRICHRDCCIVCGFLCCLLIGKSSIVLRLCSGTCGIRGICCLCSILLRLVCLCKLSILFCLFCLSTLDSIVLLRYESLCVLLGLLSICQSLCCFVEVVLCCLILRRRLLCCCKSCGVCLVCGIVSCLCVVRIGLSCCLNSLCLIRCFLRLIYSFRCAAYCAYGIADSLVCITLCFLCLLCSLFRILSCLSCICCSFIGYAAFRRCILSLLQVALCCALLCLCLFRSLRIGSNRILVLLDIVLCIGYRALSGICFLLRVILRFLNGILRCCLCLRQRARAVCCANCYRRCCRHNASYYCSPPRTRFLFMTFSLLIHHTVNCISNTSRIL